MFAKKSLGQNFLMHRQTASRIVEASGVSSGDVVLEVGPGTGMLTRELLARVKTAIAVEADHALSAKLSETFAQELSEGRLVLYNEDIRTFDTKRVDGAYALVANIPYYITGELIRKFLTSEHKPASMTLLVQKEVAARIARSKKESLLSLSVKAYGTPVFRFPVPRGAFVPAPNVDSAVLSITDIQPDAFPTHEAEEFFFSVLHAGFGHKRKRLAKNLEVLAPAEAVARAFAASGLEPNARAEELPLTTWQELARALSEK